MAEDIAPRILDDLESAISENNADRRRMNRLQVKAGKGEATFADANEYAGLRGKSVRNAIGNIEGSDLPNGQMYYNIASRTIEPVLNDMNQDILDIAEAATKAANEAAGIGLNPIAPDMSDNVKRLVDKATSELWDDVKDEIAAAAETLARKDVDETVRENARFQAEAGLDPKVEREASGTACQWCLDQAGTHEYKPNAEYFGRHANCSCEIWFEPGKRRGGSRQLVSSANYHQNLDSLSPEERKQHAEELRLRKNARDRERYHRNRSGLTPEEREKRATEQRLQSGLGARTGDGTILPHDPPIEIGKITSNEEYEKALLDFKERVSNDTIEHALVIESNGTMTECFGVSDRVFPDSDLGLKRLQNASISHNHTTEKTDYSFGVDDFSFFSNNSILELYGFDEKYEYRLSRIDLTVDEYPLDWMTHENYQHAYMIKRSTEAGFGYTRRKR